MLRKKHLLYYSGTLVCFLFVFVMSIQRAAVAENKPASKEITQRNLLVDREVWTSMESRRRGNDSQLAQLNIDDESNWILDYPYERSKTRWGTMAYEKPINFYCATLFIDIDFLKCPQKNSYFGFRFNDIEQNGTKIEIKFYPNQNRVSCGNIIKAYVPRPEAPLRLELVVQLTKDTLKLKYGHNTLIDTPIKYVNPNHQLFAFILSQSKVKINKLVAAIPSDALPQIKYNNVSIAPIQKQLKSPFLAYFGTHYSGPKDFGKRFSAVRGYGGTHTRLSRQPKDIAGIEPRIGPFSGKPVKIRLEDFHSQSQHTKNPKNATQLFPEITECGLTALFVIPTGSVFEDEPFDRDYAYWFYRLAHERYPKLKEYAIWQIGNEIVSRHWNPKHYKKNMTAERDKKNRREYNLDWKLDFYINNWLGPEIESIQAASRDVYKDPRAIEVAAGSMNPYNQRNIRFLERFMNSKFDSKRVPTLGNEPVWKHFDYLTIHYMLAPPDHQNTRRIDSYVSKYLNTGKVKGIWITEEHGIRGAGAPVILRNTMYFLRWVSKHGLTAQQAKVFWYGEGRRSGRGSGADLMTKMGTFFGKGKISFSSIDRSAAYYHVLVEKKSHDIMDRIMIVVLPKPGHELAIGNIELEMSKLTGVWQGEGIDYSFVVEPPVFNLDVINKKNGMNVKCNRVLVNPTAIYLKRK